MRGLVLAWACLAACSADGVYLEVRVPAGLPVNQVDLYLATDACQRGVDGFDCKAIVPPRLSAGVDRLEVPGSVFFVDDDLPFVSTPDADGSAWFYLDPSSSAAIPAAIAIGHDPDLGETGVALFGAIDVGVTQHLRIDLVPVDSTHVLGQPATEAEVWRAGNDAYRCVAAHVGQSVVYIVPRTDPDCDELPVSAGRECEPGIHLAVEPVSDAIEDQSCPLPLAGGVCGLGAAACNEPVSPQRGSCTQSAKTYCVPDQVCTCEAIDDTCLATLFDVGGSRIACTIEASIDGGGFHSCLDRQVLPISLSQQPCSAPEVSPLKDGLTKFASQAVFDLSNGDKVTVEPVVSAACQLGLAPPNATFATTLPEAPLQALVKVDAAPMTPGVEFVILPLEVTFVEIPDCAVADGTQCALVEAPGEHVRACFE